MVGRDSGVKDVLAEILLGELMLQRLFGRSRYLLDRVTRLAKLPREGQAGSGSVGLVRFWFGSALLWARGWVLFPTDVPCLL